MNQKKSDKKPQERPLDPTRDAQDLVGDTTGLTGITSGNPKDISAEPDEDVNNLDLEHQPGGVLEVKNPPPGSLGVPKESYSEKIYTKKIQNSMSRSYTASSNAIASDTSEERLPEPSPSTSAQTEQGAQTIAANENAVENTNPTQNQGQFSTRVSSDEAGEQSVSGDMPTPDSDDDTLSNAQAVGTQTHEDSEHPKELDVGRDIDEAEEYNRTH